MKRKSIPTSADFDLLKRIAKNFCIATGSTEQYKENIIRPLKSFNLQQKQKYNSDKDEWRLEVHSVQKHDSGRYECQVNTQPVRSFFVQLNVVGKYNDRILRQLFIFSAISEQFDYKLS